MERAPDRDEIGRWFASLPADLYAGPLDVRAGRKVRSEAEDGP